jgi:predicted ATPase
VTEPLAYRRPRRHVLTGAPGAGKTVLGEALERRGYPLVPEAATDVIAELQGHGVQEPWEREDFLDRIIALQRLRTDEPPVGDPDVQLFDRSPLCTLALARHLDRKVTPLLASEVARVVDQRVFEPDVFFLRPLGFVVPTAARRISYADSLRFGAVHEEVYREYGFRLVFVEVATVEQRADVVQAHLAGLSGQAVPVSERHADVLSARRPGDRASRRDGGPGATSAEPR